MNNKPLYTRKSRMEIGKIYFFTATINKWQNLLSSNECKDIILNSFDYLTKTGKINIYAFVIMPNHIHLIWKLNEKNGKEKPHSSFLKFTAHQFQSHLRKHHPELLPNYQIDASNKFYEFWKLDSLAIWLFDQHIALQKLNYIHLNPLGKKWNFVTKPADYLYSSANFYENGVKDFSFLKDIRNEF